MAGDFWKPVSKLEFVDLEELRESGQRETTSLDYKAFDPRQSPHLPKALPDALAAFANSGGGRIVFGAVDDAERILRFEGIAKEKRRAVGAGIRSASHVVQPPVDIEVKDVEIPGTQEVLFVVEVKAGQRGPFQVDGRYVQRIGDAIKAMPHTSVVHAMQAGEPIRFPGEQRLDIPLLSGGPVDQWNYGVLLSPSHDTGRVLYDPLSPEIAEVLEWLSKNAYRPLKRVDKLIAEHNSWSLELWRLGHIRFIGRTHDKLLAATPVSHLGELFSRALRDTAACLKVVAPMLIVDVTIRVWSAEGRDPFMLEWRNEYDQVTQLGLSRDTPPIESPLRRVADLVGENDAYTPETEALSRRAVEYIKLVAAENAPPARK